MGLEKQRLQDLFHRTCGKAAESIEPLPGAGSHRRYYRMAGGDYRCIGVYGPDHLENRAFLEFTKHFRSIGLNVPDLLAEDTDGGVYLIQDLGDRTLKDEIDLNRKEGDYPARIIPHYRNALEHLLRFQVEGHVGLDYTHCVPRQVFDRQSILWDLNHFKYYFLQLLGIAFDEQALEDDFHSLAAFLTLAGQEHFMYRDFQSRNIMIHEGDLYFVDYQGGRRGALQYDVASILYESRVNLSPGLREELLEYYLESLLKKTGIRPEVFREHYDGYVLIRILQAMGAYGIRGIVEGKPLFLQSIPYAIRNLGFLKEKSKVAAKLPELSASVDRICDMGDWKLEEETPDLKVYINSFSYKKGLPRDLSGNGGGFVFDCRALPNPGREERFRNFTGLDREVVEYLESHTEVGSFLEQTFSLVRQSVEEYRSMGFNQLMVSYGCTGGQHRSVYCAARLDEFVRNQLKVKTLMVHRELEK